MSNNENTRAVENKETVAIDKALLEELLALRRADSANLAKIAYLKDYENQMADDLIKVIGDPVKFNRRVGKTFLWAWGLSFLLVPIFVVLACNYEPRANESISISKENINPPHPLLRPSQMEERKGQYLTTQD